MALTALPEPRAELKRAIGAMGLPAWMVDDLRRFGAVDHRTGEPEPGPTLTPAERRLLDQLFGGEDAGRSGG